MNVKRGTIAFLWRNTKGLRKELAALSISKTVVSISLVLSSLGMRGLIDAAISSNLISFRQNAVFLLAMYVLQEASKAFASVSNERLKSLFENRLKDDLACCFLKYDYGSVTYKHSEEWMSVLTSDTSIIANSFVTILPESFSIVIRLLLISTIMIGMIPELMLFLAPAGVVMAGISLLLRRKMKVQFQEIQEADQKVRVELSEKLRNLMIIRAYSKESSSLKSVRERMEDHKEKRMGKARYSAKMSALFGAVLRGTSYLGAVVGGTKMLKGSLTYGSFYAVLQLITLVRYPATEISSIVSDFYALLSSTERVMKMMEESGSEDETNPLNTQEIQNYYDNEFKAINLRNVSFSYTNKEGKRALNNVSFSIEKGEFVGIGGASGLGKTTIMKLLLGLYKPLEGSIMLQGVVGEKELEAAYRSLFAYVPQGNKLLTGSLKDVISFWDLDPDKDKIRTSLEMTGLLEMVNALPDGVDTYIGEGGANFSEGQKQRIAIARAIYSDRPVLLLDEVTSALDEKMEHSVLDNLKNLTDKTVVIITHKKDVLSMCNRCLILNGEGRIEEA